MKSAALKSEHLSAALTAAQGFIEFVNKACTPFHAVREVAQELVAAGYTKLPEGQPWPELAPGQKVFFTRNDSSIVVFRVGGRYRAGNGIKIIGTHTDSPNFQVKPNTARNRLQYVSVAVQCYGGGLWHTWFDRELTVAGRVLVEDRSKGEGHYEARLVRVPQPLLCIPSLCIHLRNQQERESYTINKESHLLPMIATQLAVNASVAEEAPTATASAYDGAAPESSSPTLSIAAKKANSEKAKGEPQCNVLMNALATELHCHPSDIVDFDLSLIDVQPASLGGYYREFIHAPRIDNLMSCYCALKAMLAVSDEAYENDTMTTMVAMFDNEEVGSSSAQGAGGSMITEAIDYLSNSDSRTKTALVANSFLLSVDGAHAVHPNYIDKHEEAHRPMLHEGPVIKYNANVRYATTGATATKLRGIGKLAGVPLQSFVVKNDSPCGSTIGPIMSTLSGIRTVDIGNPMLAMHSVRETCGTVDTMHMINLLKAFIDKYDEVQVDSCSAV